MKTYKCNGKFYSKCRFGFPQPTKSDIMINDVVDCLAVQKNHQPRKRLYHLRRNADEVRVNDYNPALLQANEANVDVHYIGHLGSRLPYYITNYMTKHERSEHSVRRLRCLARCTVDSDILNCAVPESVRVRKR